MSRLTDFIESNLVEKDYGGIYHGMREPSLGELRRLRDLVDASLTVAMRSAPPEPGDSDDDDPGSVHDRG